MRKSHVAGVHAHCAPAHEPLAVAVGDGVRVPVRVPVRVEDQLDVPDGVPVRLAGDGVTDGVPLGLAKSMG